MEEGGSLRAFREPSDPQLGGEGNQDGGKQRTGEEEEEDKGEGSAGKKRKKEGESSAGKKPPTKVCYGTGSILHSCDRFTLVFSVAHTFASFRPAGDGPGGAPLVVEGTKVLAEFFDGSVCDASIQAIGWSHDMAIIMVMPSRTYRAVKFIDHTCSAMGFSAHDRETRIYSICTFPADPINALFATALSGKICGPPRRGRDIDPSLHRELRMFEFLMDGATGCSGAPLFTATRQVMGMWTSHVGELKFGVLVESMCEWLRSTYNIQEQTSMKHVVPRLVSIYLEHLRLLDLST
ncbi:hypothetical protein VPH35_040700 [Triticum aestivum]